jgi:peptide/nickel transport system substrate-binding protein
MTWKSNSFRHGPSDVGSARRRLTAATSVLAAGGLVFGLAGAGTASAARPAKSSTGNTAALAAATNAELGIPSSPHKGGSLTVLEGAGFAGSWTTLDPAANNSDAGAHLSYNDAIFGQLFDLGPNGRMLPDIATGYTYSNGGKTINVFLRHGVEFSDGSKLTSAVVKWNWERDIASPSSSKPIFESVQKTPPVITTHGPYEISITFDYVNAAFINELQGGDILNYIASEAAYKKMGPTAFGLKPVGAGPFEVVSDTPSTQLVLKRNPHYFLKGLPYLNTLTFKTVASDEAAYEAMNAGDGQAYEGLSTPQLFSAFAKRYDLVHQPSTSPYDIQFNTAIPPFNNIKARLAVYYAINCQLLDKKLFNNQNPCGQSFSAPAGLFYEKSVPGYPTYNLNKAKALVKQLGGLSFNLFTINAPLAIELNEALQSEFQAAGMKVSLSAYDIGTLVSTFIGGKWQIALQTAGAWDPAAGVGVCFRFCSTSPFSGVHSTQLDTLLNDAANSTNPRTRQTYYNAAAELIARNAWGPFLFALDGSNVVIHNAGAPGLSTPLPVVSVDPTILWQYGYNNA